MAFPGTYNFDYYRGDTFRFVISPKDSNGNALDLSSYFVEGERDAIFTIADARGTAATSTYSSVVELEENFPLSATIDVENSTITCTIKPDGGRYLEGGSTYYYDVEIYNGADLRYTLLTGAITVEDDVTGAE